MHPLEVSTPQTAVQRAAAFEAVVRSTLIVHECPDCGLLSGLTLPIKGCDMRCMRCTKILRRVRGYPLSLALAFAGVGILFFILSMTAPLLQARLYGGVRSSAMISGPLRLDDQGMWILAGVVLLTTIIMPIVKLFGIFCVLLGLHQERPPKWIAPLYGWLKHINPWAMTEVYMLGFIVAYTRLHLMMQVHIQSAVFGMIGLMLSLVALDTVLDPQAVWEEMKNRKVVEHPPGKGGLLIGCEVCHQVSYAKSGETCPRCGTALYERRPGSLSRTSALTLAAAIFYIPSNIFPIMTIIKLGVARSYTILGGMYELIRVGLLPLALLVFLVSIIIPVFKIFSLLVLLVETYRGDVAWLHGRTRLYRLIDFIGRWSMVDVFMVSILTAIVRFGNFGQVTAGVGAVYFATVVILTIFAVESFDPRLMWDRAAKKTSTLKVEYKILTNTRLESPKT